ncbi:MAG: DUF3786 domain-containing protein [Clostridia bacterium]|nr:DUF3786 domain-containing protein [Clostridia bacterium]MBC7346737.1 DUF3786 domain-containing protein [Clostridia bacterium]
MQVELPGNYEPAYRAAIKSYMAGNPVAMAAASGAVYDAAQGMFLIRYYCWHYRVKFPEGMIVPVEAEAEPLGQSDAIIVLHYLSHAIGTPPAGRWLSFMELPGGPLHQAPFRLEAVQPLADEFGHAPQLFLAAGQALGGYPVEMGDAGLVLPVLPHLSLAAVLWVADEEFPANANILFDAAAVDYLDTAGLYLLGINTSRRLRRLAGLLAG